MTKNFQIEIITQMLTLTTNAFGIVAALAWNGVVTTLIEDFVKPYLPAGGSVILSQLIYAVLITVLVVTVTLRLSSLKDSLTQSSKK